MKYPAVITVGELLVEIMRKGIDVSFLEPGIFLGPYPSGAPGIFISAVSRVSRARVSAGIVSVCGRDDFGRAVVGRLKKDKVDTCRVRQIKDATGVAFVRYLSDGNREFIFHIGAAGCIKPQDIKKNYFSKIRVLHITGSSLFTSQSCFSACKKALKIAIKNRATISFDPNIRKEMVLFSQNIAKINIFLKQAKILFTTEEEIFILFGNRPMHTIVEKLFDNGTEIIIVKKGEKGSEIFSNQGMIKIPPLRVDVVDPTGAGDTYAGAFIACYCMGNQIAECGKIAGIAASLKCTKQGPMSIPEYKDIEKYF
ncbi:MAG TPA: sugar kinase [bacterium]|nr:sugar kinase [bacterium]